MTRSPTHNIIATTAITALLAAWVIGGLLWMTQAAPPAPKYFTVEPR